MSSPDDTYSNLKPGQEAILFPSLGYYDAKKGQWLALVQGRVFRGDRIQFGTRLLLTGLKRAMKASPEEIASETFQSRIGGFLAAPGKRRRIALHIAGRSYRLRRRTRNNGAFYGRLKLPDDWHTHAIPPLPPDLQPNHLSRALTKDPSLTISLHLRSDTAPPSGIVHMVPPRGISIISDIDDTIKYTEAIDKQEMLANTFLRPFSVIEGMAQLYQSWRNAGCHFHYVSSSPWQLYQPLAELCQASNFPDGSMHLKYFKVRDEMFKRFRPLRRNNKVAIIAGILKRLPRRSFVLIGDSGEKDPEIYRFLARRFPRQVRAIAIREIPGRPMNHQRRLKLQTISDTTELRIFTQPEEILSLIDRL